MALNFDEEDMILPEGFDPNAESQEIFSETEEAANDAPTNEQNTAADEEVGANTGDESADTTQSTGTQQAQTIRVKFNHEERELGLEEAAILAQKGLNYDKLDQRNRELESHRTEDEWLAKQLGYDNSREMMAAAKQNLINRQIQELIDAGNTEAMAKFLVEQRMRAEGNATSASPSNAGNTSAGQEAEQERRKQEFREFAQAYPGVYQLPDEVIRANQEGVRLKTAYEMYMNKQELAQKNKELAILKQNQAAARRAPVTGATGKASPANARPEDSDPFLAGFNAD